MTLATDALGKEIVIGATYGYSNSNNGNTRIVIGDAVNVTEKGNVSLKVRASKSCYGNDLKEDAPGAWGNQKNTVSVRSCILFPVNIEDK